MLTQELLDAALVETDGRLVPEGRRQWQREHFPARVRQWPRVDQTRWRKFRTMVLAHGGYEVCPPEFPDGHVSLYLSRGRVFDGLKAETERWQGETSRCHSNVSDLFVFEEVQQIGTGYALDYDGLWRQHSWGLLGNWASGIPDTEVGIAETTVQRLRYFGIVLHGDMADRFALANRSR